MGNTSQTRTNSMHLHGAAVLLALAAIAGCRENPLVPEGNGKPVAKAGPDMTVGAAGPVQLDGSGSTDSDGEIVEYKWLSGTPLPAVDAGMGMEVVPGGRLVPDGETGTWPADEAKPTVNLTEGVWSFTLWVTDDKGAVSPPDSVTVRVGASADPVAACVNAIVDGPTDACKMCVCSIDDTCRGAVVDTVCDANCWGLIGCIGAMCPDFAAMSMATPPDFSCVTTNCSQFLAGATPARAAGQCVTMCPDDCTSM